MEKIKTKILEYIRLDSWQRWEYKHTTILLVSSAIFIFLLDTVFIRSLFTAINNLHYLGVFLAGMLSVSVFTAVPAILLFLNFEGLNPWIMALVGGAGAMVGDFIILRFIQDKLVYELKPIAMRLRLSHLLIYLQGRRATIWGVRFMGGLIIASPFPDEIGISLLNINRTNSVGFLSMCFLLDTAGFLAIIGLGRAF